MQRQVAEWAGPETSLSNDGLSSAVPASWRVLKAGQTALAAPPGTKAVLGDIRLGGLAYVMSEAAPRGVTSLDAYFDRTIARRRQEAAGLAEIARREIRAGSLRGRALDGAWSSGGARFRDLTAVWRNGGTYVALAAWVEDDGSTRPAAALDALVQGLSLDAGPQQRHAGAVESAVRDVPLLSPAAADLVVTGAALPLAPDAAFARAFALSNAGDSALTPDEVREKVVLLATAVAAVDAARAAAGRRVRRSPAPGRDRGRRGRASGIAAARRAAPAQLAGARTAAGAARAGDSSGGHADLTLRAC